MAKVIKENHTTVESAELLLNRKELELINVLVGNTVPHHSQYGEALDSLYNVTKKLLAVDTAELARGVLLSPEQTIHLKPINK